MSIAEPKSAIPRSMSPTAIDDISDIRMVRGVRQKPLSVQLPALAERGSRVWDENQKKLPFARPLVFAYLEKARS